MLMLALDTSSRLACVALGDGDDLLAESVLPLRLARAEGVLPEIARLLGACGRAPGDLRAVVVGAGPGSFTGTRTAAALAKGLCAGRGLPLYAYSSLAAIAAGSGLPGSVCALADARGGRVYAMCYTAVLPLESARETTVLSTAELLRRAPPAEGWTYAGDGALRNAEAIRAAGGGILPPHLALPRAAALLWLARTQPEAGRVSDPGTWEPEYVRATAAERAAEVRGREPAAEVRTTERAATDRATERAATDRPADPSVRRGIIGRH